MKRKSPGLFNGFWNGNEDGVPIVKRPIRREEYAELYRLHRIGRQLGLQVEKREAG